MPQINATIKVAAPVDVLFRTVEAPPAPLLPDRAPRLVRLGKPFGPGAIYRWEFRRLGLNFRVESVVAEYDSPRPLFWLIPGMLVRLGIWHEIRQVKSLAEASASMPPPPQPAKQQP